MTIDRSHMLDQVEDAYLQMEGKAHYRPAAPGDGFGDIELTEDELQDRSLLILEAREYAKDFLDEEGSATFFIGTASFSYRKAMVYIIEAAKQMCTGNPPVLAKKLLLLALDELSDDKLVGPDTEDVEVSQQRLINGKYNNSAGGRDPFRAVAISSRSFKPEL